MLDTKILYIKDTKCLPCSQCRYRGFDCDSNSCSMYQNKPKRLTCPEFKKDKGIYKCDLTLKNGLVWIDGKWEQKNVNVYGRKIWSVDDRILGEEVIDCSGLKIIPGIIDPHVHFQLDCGRVTSVDDFYYGGKTAAYGGVTTIVDFLDPSNTVENLWETYNRRKQEAEKCPLNYHFHSCIKMPKCNLEDYVIDCLKLGIRTVKLFTTYSDTGRRTYDEDIIELLKLSKKYGVLICAHIEADDMIQIKPEMTYKDLPVSRPGYSETMEAIKLAKYAKETGGYLYMVHCSSGETLRQLKDEFSDILGKNLFIESCPQYFVFNQEFLNDENGKLFTFAPPLRSERERQLLVANFDMLDTIGTDHCSFMSYEKDWPTLAGFPLGVGGIENSFSILYKRFGDKVIDKMTKNVAELEDFVDRGELKPGFYADIAVFKEIDNYRCKKPHGRCDYSIYEGVLGAGEFVHTIVNGKFVLKNGEFIEQKGHEINCGEKL